MHHFAVALFMLASASADVVFYEGRLSVDGVPHQGSGRFKFAIIGDQGATLWASKEMTVNAREGAYTVRLGDSAQAPTISTAVLRGTPPPKLRISFYREGKGWAAAGADVPLSGDRPGARSADPRLGAGFPGEAREPRAMQAANRPPAFPQGLQTVTMSTAGLPSFGKADAPLVLIEFIDFQDPQCIRIQTEVIAPLKTKYVDTGKLRIVSRHLLLPLHQHVDLAARAAFCAGSQGRFWPMRERLFAANGALPAEAIRQAAQDAGLDLAQFDLCWDGQLSRDAILADAQNAGVNGITAPPAFFLGRAVDERVAGLKITGQPTAASLEAEIEKLLAALNHP